MAAHRVGVEVTATVQSSRTPRSPESRAAILDPARGPRYPAGVTLPLEAHLRRPLPRRPLARLPSPLESHPALAAECGLASFLVKRDDLAGGNKRRALEWLLPAAGPALVTMGAYGSTWCAALAAATGGTGQRAEVALFPQPWSAAVAGALGTTVAGAGVHLAARRWQLPLAVARAWGAARRHGPVTWLPAGGATPLGVLGSVNALLECAGQLTAEGFPRPEAIVVPYGSGGTAAGLLVGAGLLGWPVTIVAVRVTDPWFTTRRRILSLAARTRALLGAPAGAATLRLDGAQLGAGYGHDTTAAATARVRLAERGILLDATYSAKACAAVRSLAGSFRHVCFWHTFDPSLVAPPMDHPVLRDAHRYAESLWPPPTST